MGVYEELKLVTSFVDITIHNLGNNGKSLVQMYLIPFLEQYNPTPNATTHITAFLFEAYITQSVKASENESVKAFLNEA